MSKEKAWEEWWGVESVKCKDCNWNHDVCPSCKGNHEDSFSAGYAAAIGDVREVKVSVVKFYPKNAAKNPDAVLERAVGQYESVIIIGYDFPGEMDVRASTNIDAANVLWLIETFKFKLINGDFYDEKEEA